MSNPSAGDVHVNQVLTQFSIAYMQNPAGFVADRVFPSIPVMKQSDRYFTYSRADFNRDTMKKRAPGTESAGDGFRIDNTPSYYADVWALHKDIEDQTRSNADAPFNIDRDTTLFLSQKAIINREVNWAANFFTTGVWGGVTGAAGTDVTGVSASPGANQILQWDNASSTPITDVRIYADKIHLFTGYRPNKMVMGRQVWTKIQDHPSFTDRIKYSSSNNTPAIVTQSAVAQVLELGEILVMDAIKNTGAENDSQNTAGTPNAGESNVFIGGKSALMCYVNPAPSIMTPASGYTFNWTGFTGAGGLGQRIKTFRMENLESDRVEIQQAYTQKLIAAELGVYFASLVA